MKNETTNTRKTVLQSDERAPVGKASSSTTQDNTALMRRRRLLKGLGAVPLVITLDSGAQMAAQSNVGGCVGPQDITPTGCVATPDKWLRSEVLHSNGKDTNGIKNKLYDNSASGDNLCLVSVDSNGDVMTDGNHYVNDTSRVVTTSCWASFV